MLHLFLELKTQSSSPLRGDRLRVFTKLAVCNASWCTVEIDHSHFSDVMVLISCLICFLSSVNGNRLAADSTMDFRHALLIINYGRQH